MEAVYKRFNSQFGILVDMLVKKSNDPKIDDLNTLYISMRNNTPNQIIELIGPHLWEQREYIKKRDINYFLTKSYVDDDANAKLVDMIKKLWVASEPKEKDLVVNIICKMLSTYVEYLKLDI